MSILEPLYTQAKMQERAAELGHLFQWCEDTRKLDGDTGKKYNSIQDIETFLVYYNDLPRTERHHYEIVNGAHYMFFDLDVKLDQTLVSDIDSKLDDVQLYMWFDGLYREFVSNLIAGVQDTDIVDPTRQKLVNSDPTSEYKVKHPNWKNEFTNHPLKKADFNILNPDWIVTTSSSDKKLSLHLINRNVIFNDNKYFKAFYSKFQAYIHSFISEKHPFFRAFDVSVSSKNRGMRLTGSAKLDSDRVLRVHPDIHPLGMKIQNTFITSAIHDPNVNKKLFSDAFAKVLFTERTNEVKQRLTGPQPTFELIDAKNKDHLAQVKMLLSILSDERAISYNSWRDIAFIFKQHNLPYELFEEFSKRSPQFNTQDCRDGWDNIEIKDIDKPLTLGTLHFYAREDSPAKYEAFRDLFQQHRVDICFTPHNIINERFIPSQLYIHHFKTKGIIALQSNMMTGKTFALPEVYKNIEGPVVVVYFRVTLSRELVEKWKEQKYEFYQDIQGPIDLTKHPRIVIQIDSLPRLIGKCELLVLDEIESTHSHLCSSKFINHQDCFNSLRDYIKHTPKVLLADANLSDQTVDVLVDKRLPDTVKIQNKYQSFCHLKATMLNDKQHLIQIIVEQVSNGKRVCIPTNSLRFSKQITELLRSKFSQKKVLLINSETTKDFSETSVATWTEYDILVYTPSIVAGVSFDIKDHFHSCCAYFISRSSNAEMSSQMLFRVRHLIDHQMYICTPHNTKSVPSQPITLEEIDAHLNRMIEIGHQHLQQAGLSIEHFHSRVKKNQYYKLYSIFLQKRNISNLYFESNLRTILKNHGVEITKHRVTKKEPLSRLSDKEKKKLEEEFRQTMSRIDDKEITDLIQVPPIDPTQYGNLRETKKEKTREQHLQITKFQLLNAFSVRWDTSLNECREWIEQNKDYIYPYNYIKNFLGEKIVDSIDVARQKHEEKYNQNFCHDVNTYLSNSYSSDSEDDNPRYTDPLQKKDIRASVVPSINYDKKWLKVRICFEFLRHLGFQTIKEYRRDMIPDERGELIRPNWSALHEYCRTNEENIRAVFDCKIMKWKDELVGREKNILSIFVNQKLDDTIGLKVTSTSNKRVLYHIQFLFQPLLPSALKEKQEEEQSYWDLEEMLEEEEEIIDEEPEEDTEARRDFTRMHRRERKNMREKMFKDDED